MTTGTRDDSYWEIVEGLREGDQVLVGDVSNLQQEATSGGGHGPF